jgi:outer membrane lipoprotein carrier protein
MRYCVTLILTFMSALAHAGVAERLAERLQPYQQFSAVFSQRVVDGYDVELSQLEGTLALDGSTRFRWQTDPPLQQLIVADGEVLWIFDEDLFQVQVRPLDAALSASPAAILGGSAERLDADFSIIEATVDELTRFELRPRATDDVVESVVLLFAAEQLQALEFRDALGQVTRVTFDAIDTSLPAPENFEFIPPAGVDVIYALDQAP